MNTPSFSTPDLGLAATLFCAGHRLAGTQKSGSKVEFRFEDLTEAQETADLYWLDRVEVNPREYFDAVRFLKSHLRNA